MEARLLLADPTATGRLGEWLGRTARPGDVFYLEGPLGAGKTTLVQGLCRGLGVSEDVTSPTFALVHEYEAPLGPVFHLDVYRLDPPVDLDALGWWEPRRERGIAVVEWADRLAGDDPGPGVRVLLAHAGEARRVTLTADPGAAPHWVALLAGRELPAL